MLIIKSSGNLDKLNAILDKMAENTEQFIVLLPEECYEEETRILGMGGSFVYHDGDDWLWVTDDNWDGDLSGILPSVG